MIVISGEKMSVDNVKDKDKAKTAKKRVRKAKSSTPKKSSKDQSVATRLPLGASMAEAEVITPKATGATKAQANKLLEELGHYNLSWGTRQDVLALPQENPVLKALQEILVSPASSPREQIQAAKLLLESGGLAVDKAININIF